MKIEKRPLMYLQKLKEKQKKNRNFVSYMPKLGKPN